MKAIVVTICMPPVNATLTLLLAQIKKLDKVRNAVENMSLAHVKLNTSMMLITVLIRNQCPVMNAAENILNVFVLKVLMKASSVVLNIILILVTAFVK